MRKKKTNKGKNSVGGTLEEMPPKTSTLDSASNLREEVLTHYFWQGIYSFELDYNPDDSHTYSMGLGATCPNTFPGGTNTTQLYLGYSQSPTDSTQCGLTVIKGLSPVDVDWGVLLQFTKGF